MYKGRNLSLVNAQLSNNICINITYKSMYNSISIEQKREFEAMRFDEGFRLCRCLKFGKRFFKGHKRKRTFDER